ncbi:DsbA family protein [Nocardioides aquiterrae]|uniref:Thioredoxin domain-containing protein n=1 Tax=Nocardioides aquiterrae TaxID=203799 RepID=A0ABP4EXJ6_9ACTN
MSKKDRDVARADRVAKAAALRKQQEAAERRRRTLMIGGVVVALLVIVVGGWFLSRALDTTGDVNAPAAGSEYGVTIGPKDAPHDVVIYEDFLCPFCGEFEAETHEKLATLAQDGKVRVEYRPFNLLSSLGDYSERSAGAFSIVLDTSGPEVAKKFHDLLYENQPDEKGPYPSDDDLVKWAVEAGAKESDVKGPIENHAGKDWVTAATQAALDAGVRSTPTILLDGKVFTGGRTPAELGDNLIAKVD